MGTSHSAAELGAKFSALARNLESVQKGAARSGARVIEQAVQREMRAATGGDLVLSGSADHVRLDRPWIEAGAQVTVTEFRYTEATSR